MPLTSLSAFPPIYLPIYPCIVSEIFPGIYAQLDGVVGKLGRGDAFCGEMVAGGSALGLGILLTLVKGSLDDDDEYVDSGGGSGSGREVCRLSARR